MEIDYQKEFEEEREILNRLVDEALEKGRPLSETQAVMKQCRKVDRLLLKVIAQESSNT